MLGPERKFQCHHDFPLGTNCSGLQDYSLMGARYIKARSDVIKPFHHSLDVFRRGLVLGTPPGDALYLNALIRDYTNGGRRPVKLLSGRSKSRLVRGRACGEALYTEICASADEAHGKFIAVSKITCMRIALGLRHCKASKYSSFLAPPIKRQRSCSLMRSK